MTDCIVFADMNELHIYNGEQLADAIYEFIKQAPNANQHQIRMFIRGYLMNFELRRV